HSHPYAKHIPALDQLHFKEAQEGTSIEAWEQYAVAIPELGYAITCGIWKIIHVLAMFVNPSLKLEWVHSSQMGFRGDMAELAVKQEISDSSTEVVIGHAPTPSAPLNPFADIKEEFIQYMAAGINAMNESDMMGIVDLVDYWKQEDMHEQMQPPLSQQYGISSSPQALIGLLLQDL
ncbi:hypothetical protein FRC11_003822, partial [Ceratobasidium sp. 423]